MPSGTTSNRPPHNLNAKPVRQLTGLFVVCAKYWFRVHATNAHGPGPWSKSRIPIKALRTLSALIASASSFSEGKRQNTFDPAGVARFFNIPPWVRTHGYSCLAASRPEIRGRAGMDPEVTKSEAIRRPPFAGRTVHQRGQVAAEGLLQTLLRLFRIGHLFLGAGEQVHGGIGLVKNYRSIAIHFEVDAEHIQGNAVA